MNTSRLEWRVGLFVSIGLVLVAALLLQFTKSATFFRPTYTIYLRAPNVAGLKTGAGVLMSGVQVGSVSDIELSPDGKSVTITLRIFQSYVIHQDARFMMEQSGFLGDEYVAILPTENKKPPFENGGIAYAEAPFNIQEFTRSASGFITRLDETVKKLDAALADVNRFVLNPETLTNFTAAVSNLREFSDQAVATVGNLNDLLTTNGPAFGVSSSNLVAFSEQMKEFGGALNLLVETNSPEIQATVKNLATSSESLKSALQGLQEGKGLAGNLLKNEHLAAEVSQITSNLSITSSNLNRLGLWGILWQHKPPRTRQETPPEPLLTPKAMEQTPTGRVP